MILDLPKCRCEWLPLLRWLARRTGRKLKCREIPYGAVSLKARRYTPLKLVAVLNDALRAQGLRLLHEPGNVLIVVRFATQRKPSAAAADAARITVSRWTLETIRPILAELISAGQCESDVERVLGAASPVSGGQHALAIHRILTRARNASSYFPDGAAMSDRLLRWSVGRGDVLQLQFRDGKLINYDSAWFRPHGRGTAVVSTGGKEPAMRFLASLEF
jgi:hypothetical protein